MAPISIKPESPLKDDDLSEITKNEIVYWAKKLRMSPSDMFLLSNEELEEQLSMVRKSLKSEESEKPVSNQLIDTKNNLRLRADGKQIWSILIETAGKIQDVLTDENEPLKFNEEKKVVLRERMKGGMNASNACPPMNATFVGCDCPNNPARLNWPKPFTNATNYTMSYGPRGTEERADSVSVEPIDASSGIITVSTRIYSTPSPIPCLCPENPLNQQPGAELAPPAITVTESTPEVQCPVQQTPVRQRGVQRGRPRQQKTLAESVPERIRRRLTRRHIKRPTLQRRGPLFPPLPSPGTLLEDETPPTGFERSAYATAQCELLESQTPPSGFEGSAYTSWQNAYLEDAESSAFNEAAYGTILEDVSPPSGFDNCPSMSANVNILGSRSQHSIFNEAAFGSILEDESEPSDFNECPSISPAPTLLDNISPPSRFNELTYDSTLENISAPPDFDECPSISPPTTLLENVTQPSLYDEGIYDTYLEDVTAPSGFLSTGQDESEIEIESPFVQNITRPIPCPPSSVSRVSPPSYTSPAQTRIEPNYGFQTPLRKVDIQSYKPRKLFPRSPGCPPLFSPRDENRVLSPEQYYSPEVRPRFARGRPMPRPLAAALPEHIRRRLQRPLNQRSPLRRKHVAQVCPTESEGTLIEDESPPTEMSFTPSGNSTEIQDTTQPSVYHRTFEETECEIPAERPPVRYVNIHSTRRRPIDMTMYRPRRLPLSPSYSRTPSPEFEQIERMSPPSGFDTSQSSVSPTLCPSVPSVSRSPAGRTQIYSTPKRPVHWSTYRPRRLQMSSGSPRTVSHGLEQLESTSPPFGFDSSTTCPETSLMTPRSQTMLENVTPPSGLYSSMRSINWRSSNSPQCPVNSQNRLYSGESSYSSEDNLTEYWENPELTSPMPSPMKFGWNNRGSSSISPTSSIECPSKNLNTPTYDASFSRSKVFASTPVSSKSFAFHEGSAVAPSGPPRQLTWSNISSQTSPDNLLWEASNEDIVFGKFASPTNSDCIPPPKPGLEDYFLNL